MIEPQPHDEVIIFTRYPESGKVKTRLIPKLGDQGAARIHRLLTDQIITSLLPLQQSHPVQLSLYFSGGSQAEMRNWLGNSLFMSPQKGKDLGRRMATAFKETWSRGARKAVIIGSDCPFIEEKLILHALNCLKKNDVVLGPAYDGGYYLLGLHSSLTGERFNLFFDDIAWGTPYVFQQTLEKAKKAHLAVSTLKRLHDIDRQEDLKYFRHHTDTQ